MTYFARTNKAAHACCPAAAAVLRGYRMTAAQDAFRWTLAGTRHTAIYCPWCGVQLEAWRKDQSKLRAVSS